MYTGQRKNGLAADWTAFAVGINDGRMAVLGKHQNPLVGEHAGASIDEGAQTVPPVTRIGQQTSNTKGFSDSSIRSSGVPG